MPYIRIKSQEGYPIVFLLLGMTQSCRPRMGWEFWGTSYSSGYKLFLCHWVKLANCLVNILHIFLFHVYKNILVHNQLHCLYLIKMYMYMWYLIYVQDISLSVLMVFYMACIQQKYFFISILKNIFSLILLTF